MLDSYCALQSMILSGSFILLNNSVVGFSPSPNQLNLSIYYLFKHLYPSKVIKYDDGYTKMKGLSVVKSDGNINLQHICSLICYYFDYSHKNKGE
jgi:hypothetical protein